MLTLKAKKAIKKAKKAKLNDRTLFTNGPVFFCNESPVEFENRINRMLRAIDQHKQRDLIVTNSTRNENATLESVVTKDVDEKDCKNI
jgi:hypothetical protein